MLGFGQGKHNKDSLPVLVQVIQDAETFNLVSRVWSANSPNVRIVQENRKEFLHFKLIETKQAIWLERDQSRKDSFEIILSWEEKGIRYYDVYAIVPSPAGISSGDTSYVKQVLNALMSTPATLPVDDQAQK
jgi:hypothetical protein